jgi:hypothetical protein
MNTPLFLSKYYAKIIPWDFRTGEKRYVSILEQFTYASEQKNKKNLTKG